MPAQPNHGPSQALPLPSPSSAAEGALPLLDTTRALVPSVQAPAGVSLSATCDPFEPPRYPGLYQVARPLDPEAAKTRWRDDPGEVELTFLVLDLDHARKKATPPHAWATCAEGPCAGVQAVLDACDCAGLSWYLSRSGVRVLVELDKPYRGPLGELWPRAQALIAEVAALLPLDGSPLSLDDVSARPHQLYWLPDADHYCPGATYQTRSNPGRLGPVPRELPEAQPSLTTVLTPPVKRGPGRPSTSTRPPCPSRSTPLDVGETYLWGRAREVLSKYSALNAGWLDREPSGLPKRGLGLYHSVVMATARDWAYHLIPSVRGLQLEVDQLAHVLWRLMLPAFDASGGHEGGDAWLWANVHDAALFQCDKADALDAARRAKALSSTGAPSSTTRAARPDASTVCKAIREAVGAPLAWADPANPDNQKAIARWGVLCLDNGEVWAWDVDRATWVEVRVAPQRLELHLSRKLHSGCPGLWPRWPEAEEGVKPRPILALESYARHGVNTTTVLDWTAQTARLDGHNLIVPALAHQRPAPRYDATCDRWLRLMFGARYDDAARLIARWADLSRPAAALVVTGPPGTGKGTLTEGLGRWLGSGVPVGFERVGRRFAAALVTQPVAWADEGEGLRGAGRTNILRAFLGNGVHQVEPKGLEQRELRGQARLVVTINEADALGLTDRLDPNGREALQQRLAHVEAGVEAARFLSGLMRSKGYDALKAAIPGHLEHLAQTTPPEPLNAAHGRFCGWDSSWLTDRLVGDDTTERVLCAIRDRPEVFKVVEGCAQVSVRGLHRLASYGDDAQRDARLRPIAAMTETALGRLIAALPGVTQCRVTQDGAKVRLYLVPVDLLPNDNTTT